MHSLISPLFLSQIAQEQMEVFKYLIIWGVVGFFIGLILMWLILRVKITSLLVRQEEQSRTAKRSIADLEAGVTRSAMLSSNSF